MPRLFATLSNTKWTWTRFSNGQVPILDDSTIWGNGTRIRALSRFPALPTSRRCRRLIDDPEVGANFLVLMIVRLRRRRLLESTALAFRRCTHPVPVPLEPDPDFTPTEGRAWRWLKSLLRSG